MSRLLLNRHCLARLFHSRPTQHVSSPQQQDNRSPERSRPVAPRYVREASRRFDLPQRRRNYESRPIETGHDPRAKFEPFPYAVTEENKVDILRRVVTPLFDVPYGVQLESKDTHCRNILRSLAQELQSDGTPVRLDVRRLPCQVNKIVPAIQMRGYRNSEDLSIWNGHDGKTLTVGLNVFSIAKHGDTVSVEPNQLEQMRDEARRVTDILQEFIRTQTKVGACFSLGDEGGWRMFQVYTNVDGEVLLSGDICPRTMKVSEVVDERDTFRDFVVKRCEEEGIKLKSLHYRPNPYSMCSPERVPHELLYGEKYIVETLGEFKFILAPMCHYYHGANAKALIDTVRSTLKSCFMSSSIDESSSSFSSISSSQSDNLKAVEFDHQEQTINRDSDQQLEFMPPKGDGPSIDLNNNNDDDNESNNHNAKNHQVNNNDSNIQSMTRAVRKQRQHQTGGPIILEIESRNGMLSIGIADMVSRAISIVDSTYQVELCQANARLNNLTNCEYIHANFETVLQRILQKYRVGSQHREMILLVDLKHGLLREGVFEEIRQCRYIKKIVLVTYNLSKKSTQENILRLCRKGGARSLPPFAPLLATPVDFCPNTQAYATVMALERVPGAI